MYARNIVITGSSRGIGLALARKFLEEGHNVCITSRSQESVEGALATVQDLEGRAIGRTSDVTDTDSIATLIEFVMEEFSGIDIWINNAGIDTGYDRPMDEYDTDDITRVITTNLLGTMYCNQQVLRLMKKQGQGHIFQMDGLGSNGRIAAGYTPYVVSKRAIPILSKSLAKEYKDTGVGVHTLSPGMVITPLLYEGTDGSARRIFNILADTPENVADFLVPRVLNVRGTGKYIKFLTTPKVLVRFMTAWRYKNRFFDEEGNLHPEYQ